MGTMAQQLIGFFLSLLGLVGSLASTVLPSWGQTAYFSSNFITASYYMKGLWMECVSHTAGIYQCEFYRSVLSLPNHLLAARILMVLSCTTSVLSAIVSSVGMKCTHCTNQSLSKGSMAVIGGSGFVLAGILCLFTTSWTTFYVIKDAYHFVSTAGIKYELGLALYISMSSAIFSICGGGILCVSSWDVGNYGRHKVAEQQLPTQLQHMPAHKANSGFKNDHLSPVFPKTSGYRVSDSISESIESKT